MKLLVENWNGRTHVAKVAADMPVNIPPQDRASKRVINLPVEHEGKTLDELRTIYAP